MPGTSSAKTRFALLPGHDVERYVVALTGVFAALPNYASPSVSNIAALIASAAVLPAQTTNWNAG